MGDTLMVKKSELEKDFLEAWEEHGPTGYELVNELKFCDGRRWKFDFAVPTHMIAIELEGLNGRHQSNAGFIKDCEKYNTATSMGWRVLRFTRSDLRRPEEMMGVIEATLSFVEDDAWGGLPKKPKTEPAG